MKRTFLILNYIIAAVWFINGFFCKLLDLVPRHQQIVERILGIDHGRLLTVLIGLAEVFMSLWILSGLYRRMNVITQIVVIATMNSLEFFLAPDLLLWGKMNAVFAFMFIGLIYYNEFHLGKHFPDRGIKDHPFAVEAFFQSSIVLTFAVPKEELQKLIPPCLQLDLFEDQWAFIAVAMVQTKDLRPKGFPKFMGKDFFLVGYRVFVRFTTSAGKNLRGLYILKSQTDKTTMEFFGNIFTHYNYTTTDISAANENGSTEIFSKTSDFKVRLERNNESQVALPANSPFRNWKEARRYAGPLPFTFTYHTEDKTVLVIEGVRENWDPMPIKAVDYQFSFIDQLNLKGARLANAFVIEDIPYYWKKGKIEEWKIAE